MMRRIRVCVGTLVFGGIEDQEFRVPSLRFFHLVRKGKYTVLVSPITLDELDGAPKSIKAVLAELPQGGAIEVSLTRHSRNQDFHCHVQNRYDDATLLPSGNTHSTGPSTLNRVRQVAFPWRS